MIPDAFSGMVYLIMKVRIKKSIKPTLPKVKSSRIFSSSLVLALLFLLTTGAMGSTVAYREAGLEMTIPEGLILEINNGFLTVVDTERTMTLRITLSTLQIVEQFFGPLEQELSNFVDQPEVQEEHPKIKVNDTLQYYAEGLGLLEEEIVDWHLAFIAGGRRSLLIIGLGDVSSHMDKINTFYQSFRLLELPIPPEPEEDETQDQEGTQTNSGAPPREFR